MNSPIDFNSLIIDVVRKEDIPVRYFGFASARKCAEQLVLCEQAAAE